MNPDQASFTASARHLDDVSGSANLSMTMTALVADAHRGELASPRVDGISRKFTRDITRPSLLPEPKSFIFKDGQAVHSTMLRVGLLEDNPIEAEGITRLFEENGYKVEKRSSGADFLKLLMSESFDMLVLDWNVPDVSGIDVLYQVRDSMQLATPVIMLTSRVSEYDIVQALNRGADDYLQKPWKPFELMARVKATMRRQRYISVQQDERYSDFVLEPRTTQVTRHGQTVKLSHKEFLLFQLLIRHLGSPVSRAHIVQSVWNGENLEARTLDVHISRLRIKLGLTMNNGISLASIYGYGYRLEKLVIDERKNVQ
jgi:DNA-binding response OmpR family regulator